MARLLVGAGLTVIATWIYRWLAVDFTNDHFVHLSRARQILIGELPVRDFFDTGSLLHYYASAAMLDLFGQHLLGEALLTITAIATGAAVTFFLAARGSRSLIVGTLAALITVILFPRLYNYPKLVLYPLALLFIWGYAARPTTRRLAMLAGVPVLAFLFRHDHGLYIGLVCLTTVVLAHAGSMRLLPAALARFVVIAAALALPYLAYVQWSSGLDRYVRGIAGQGVEAMKPRLIRLPFALDRRARWFAIDPPSVPRVSIRWQADIDRATRLERERRYGLADGTSDGKYELTNTTPANIRALVTDPLVVDTQNIDREQLRLVVRQSWLQRARNSTPLLRVRIAANLFTEANSLALLYYLISIMPLVGIAAMAWAWHRRTMTGFDVTTMGAAVVMCVVINQGLVRESPDSRLGDVISPAVILAAWSIGLARRSPVTERTWLRPVMSVARGAVWLIALWCAAIFGQAGERLQLSGILAGPRAVVERWNATVGTLSLRPIDWYAPRDSTGVQALTRYVHECTRPSDRLLVAWFEPQIFFYAERPFAGGQVYLEPPWHASPDDQRLTIQRLAAQRVPIVLTNSAADTAFRGSFGEVYEYVMANYSEAGRSGFGAAGEYAVFVRRELTPKRTYEPLKLPCFR
jgi:hypothetical protein